MTRCWTLKINGGKTRKKTQNGALHQVAAFTSVCDPDRRVQEAAESEEALVRAGGAAQAGHVSSDRAEFFFSYSGMFAVEM